MNATMNLNYLVNDKNLLINKKNNSKVVNDKK